MAVKDSIVSRSVIGVNKDSTKGRRGSTVLRNERRIENYIKTHKMNNTERKYKCEVSDTNVNR